MKMSAAARHRTVEQYEAQLKELKTNSKPMINSLTMLAEDCIRQAEVIVEITEKHLRRVDPEFKLPILYLIDSIVKNVKQEYIGLFSNNIVTTFTQTFEQVKKVPDKTRRELWKLRQTWNEVFAYSKLYAIDFKCHQIDPGWPVIAPPQGSSKIHVNPKFIQRALASTSSPTTSVTSTIVANATSSPSLTIPGLADLTSNIATDADMDPVFKAQLLQKQKELLELQAKKIELELLAAQKQYELSKIQSVKQSEIAKPAEVQVDANQKQQHLLHQAELAKLQKERVATILSTSTPTPAPSAVSHHTSSVPTPTITVTTSAPTEAFQDPRKRRIARAPQEEKKKLDARDTNSRSSRLSPTPITTALLPHPVSPIAIIPPLPMPSALTSPSSEWKRDKSPISDAKKHDFRKRSRDRSPPANNVSPNSFSSGSRPTPSPSRSPSKGSKSSSPTKEPAAGPMDDPRKRKSKDSKGQDHSKKDEKRDKDSTRETRRSRQSSSSSSAVSPTHDGESPTKRRKKSTQDRSEKESKDRDRDGKKKDDKRVGSKGTSSSSSRRRRDSGGSSGSFSPTKSSTKESNKEWERTKDNLNARRNAVLKKNYRRTTEVSKMEDEDKDKKDKENLQRGGRDGRRSTEPMLLGAGGPAEGILMGDQDFRMQILHDVDLRNEAALAAEKEGGGDQPPPMKKARNGNLIDDLFGREDVDLRQQAAAAAAAAATSPTSTTWAQMKKKPDMLSSNARILDIRKDDEIHDILQNHQHPPPAISPANSIDSSRGVCDPLGRPLLYNRLPDDPAERKRSLDSRTSIDPVEKFRNQFIEQPSNATGHLSNSDLEKAVAHARQQFQVGFFTKDQFTTVCRQLMQINEVNKIRDFEMQQQIRSPGDHHGPNPWTEPKPSWGQFGATTDFAASGGSAFGEANPWETPAMPWGQGQQPRGPNPFEEAAAAAGLMNDVIPPANPIELESVRKDSSGTIPIDKVMRQVRFYGETAVVLQGPQGDEPREISFHRGTPKNVYIDKEREPIRCFIGKPAMIYLDRQKHTLKLGAPTRELYIDGDHYEACFGGPPTRIKVGRYFHSFKLEGPPPQVELGKTIRHDLLAGRVNLFVDGNAVGVYLDDKPQLIDLCGVPVILRFCDGFHTVLLNGRPFTVEFGGHPMRVTLPSGRKLYLRFAGLSGGTRKAIVQFNKAREGEVALDGPFGGQSRGRGRRSGGRGVRDRSFNIPPTMPGGDVGRMGMAEDAFYSGMPPSDVTSPLDVLADIVPPDVLNTPLDKAENSYESLERTGADVTEESPAVKKEADSTSGALDVQDLLSKLMMAGLLPAAAASAEPKEEAKPEVEVKKEEKKEEKKQEKKVIPPLETVDVSWDKLKERRDKLIAQICTGIQCGSCGLRFPPDQNVRYSQHLDWHFRQNRREKANAKKALSRKWYYDLSDWIQFAEVEDLEERAQSLFETQETEMDHDQRSPGTVLNPDLYTVPSASHEGAICPQCNESFETFFDEDKEEWLLRDAFLAESDEPGVMKLYHPICHQDFMAAVQGRSTLMEPEPAKVQEEPEKQPELTVEAEPSKEEGKEEEEEEVAEVIPQTPEEAEEEDEEVLILKEGKPEPVIMDILDEDEEMTVPDDDDDDESVEKRVASPVSVDAVERDRKDSDNQNEENICTNLDGNIVNNINNKTDEVFDNADDNGDHSMPHIVDPQVSSSSEPSSSVIRTEELLLPVEEQPPSSPPPSSSSDVFESSEPNIFDLILGGSNQGSSPPEIEQLEERPFKPITYQSMKFDVPTPIIKDEPVDTEEQQEAGTGSLDDEMRANLEAGEGVATVPSTSQPEAIDIDLTGDEDAMDGFAGPPAPNAIEGNFFLGGEAPAPLAKVGLASRIKINIMDALITTDSQSPKQSPSRATEEGPESMKVSEDNTKVSPSSSSVVEKSSSDSENLISESELARLKPRLAGVKLTNYPPKRTGQEVSGLCTIC